ncbi:hypothetical protein [Citrobacter arsenatis]|uniref:hypothetical protein n=1 Tax=Citrobacter arsenatis TaxID=2546350 RepID=UPI00300DC1CC
MGSLLNWLYIFMHKAIWIIALIIIFALINEPLMHIINHPDSFAEGNFYCLYYLVWIITVILGVYFVTKILSIIITFDGGDMFIREKSDEQHELNKIEQTDQE